MIQYNFKLTHDISANVCRGGEGKEVKVDESPDNPRGDNNNVSNSSSLSVQVGTLSSVSSDEKLFSWQREGGRETQDLSEGRAASEEVLFCPEMSHIREDGNAGSKATHLPTNQNQEWSSSSVIPFQSIGALDQQSF